MTERVGTCEGLREADCVVVGVAAPLPERVGDCELVGDADPEAACEAVREPVPVTDGSCEALPEVLAVAALLRLCEVLGVLPCDGVSEPLGLTETLPDAEWLLVRDALAEVVWVGVTVALLLPDKDLLCDWLRVGDVDGDAVVLGVGVVVVDGVCEVLPLSNCDPDPVALGVAIPERVFVRVCDGVCDLLRCWEPEGVGVAAPEDVPVGEALVRCVPVEESVAVPLSVQVTVPLDEAAGESDPLCVRLGDAVCVCDVVPDTVGLGDGPWEPLPELVRVPTWDAVDEAVVEGEPVGVRVPLRVEPCVLVAVREAVCEAVALCEGACEAVLLRVTPPVKLGVSVDEGVRDRDGVPLRVNVAEGLSVGLGVPACEAEPVLVGDWLAVGAALPVCVWDAVDEADSDFPGVEDAVLVLDTDGESVLERVCESEGVDEASWLGVSDALPVTDELWLSERLRDCVVDPVPLCVPLVV